MGRIKIKNVFEIGFEQLADEFLFSIEKKTTKATYTNQLKQFGNVLAELAPEAYKNINNLTANNLRAVLGELEKKYKKNTYKGQYVVFKSMVRFGVAEETLDSEIDFEKLFKRVKVKKADDSKKQSLPTADDIMKLRIQLEQDCNSVFKLKVRTAVELMLCGLRITETLSLRWEDVSFKDGVCFFWADQTKSEKDYPQQLSKTAVKLLKQLEQFKTTEFVFDGKAGQPIHRNAVADYLRKQCQAVGIQNINPHLLRKYCATKMLEDGIPLNIISKAVLHHSSLATTERYILNNQNKAFETLKNYF